MLDNKKWLAYELANIIRNTNQLADSFQDIKELFKSYFDNEEN